MEKRIIPLSRMQENTAATIRLVGCDDVGRDRLLAFGVTMGSAVTMLHKSRVGGPSAIGVMGTVLALRAEDLDRVMVEPNVLSDTGAENYD